MTYEFDRRGLLAASGATFGALALGSRAFAFDPTATSVTQPVKTSNGPIRGYVAAGVYTFKGVRYGAPPVGPLRFMPPQKPKPWTDVADCLQFGPAAMQQPGGGSVVAQPGTVGPALTQLMTPAEDVVRQSEDCLFLNVWTPALTGSKKRAVMVWIHGGGYGYGSGAWPVYDGHNLAKRHDVVMVGVNHRLNAFGYGYVGGIGGDPTSGNAGMLDLVQVLDWIKDNIETFGGDPDRVMVFGQSGGGSKVSTLMAMPSAKGKFQRASVESGASLTNGSKDAAAASMQVLMKKLGVTTLKQLQDVPAQMMFDVLTGRANPGNATGTMAFAPIIDGVAIPTPAFTPVANPLAQDVAVMVGCTADEQTLYTIGGATFGSTTFDQLTTQYGADQVAAARKAKPAYNAPNIGAFLASKGTWRSSVQLAERKSAQPAGTYMWVWDWPSPGAGGALKSPHTMELPFCFDNVDKGPLLLGVNGKIDPSTFKLATAVSTAWSNFAKTGDPNAPGLLPHWPRYNPQTRATMFFNKPSHVVDDPWPVLRTAPPAAPRRA